MNWQDDHVQDHVMLTSGASWARTKSSEEGCVIQKRALVRDSEGFEEHVSSERRFTARLNDSHEIRDRDLTCINWV